MSAQKRVKRPSPARTQPVRNWSSIFGGGAANGSEGVVDPATGGTVNDLVTRSVQLGYRVVDEYIRQGQRAAQRVNERSYDPQAMAGEMQQMASQMGRFASDFAALWFELMRMTAPGMAGVPPVSAPAKPRRAKSAAPDAASESQQSDTESVRVKVEVASVRPAEVAVNLTAAGDGRELTVSDLRAVDPKLPVLQGVAFANGGGGERTLRVRVPNDHPAGIYNGLILDRDSGRPVGTVSIKIAKQ